MSHWREFFDESILRRLDRLKVAPKAYARPMGRGSRAGRFVGDGLEFADHRPYVLGDDPRYIDWHCYARAQKLLLRMFHQHSEADIAVMLDVSSSMRAGDDIHKFNYARSVAAAMAYVAMGGHERVLIIPFSDDIKPAHRTGRNRSGIFGALEFLAGLVPSGTTRLLHCVQRALGEHRSVGSVIVVSDLLDCDDLARPMDRLRLSGIASSIVHVFSSGDSNPDMRGELLLEHAETRQRLVISRSNELIQEYRREWDKFQENCRRQCLAGGSMYVAAPTDGDLERLVFSAMPAAGIFES